MSLTPCPQEQAVARAARTGSWNESLSLHTRQCAACGEVSVVAGALREMARPAETFSLLGTGLPDASLLWWKHELMERYARSERAHRPIRIMDALAGGFALLALMIVATVVGLVLPGAIETAAVQGTSQLLASALSGNFTLAGVSPLLSAVAIAAICGVGLLYPLWRER